MDMTLIDFLNSAGAETTGGLITSSIIFLAKKVKDYFKGKPITDDALDELISSNPEALQTVKRLQDELIEGGIINFSKRVEVKNQFNYSKFEHTIFN